MNIIAVDDETLALRGLASSIQKAVPTATVTTFERGADALGFTEQNTIDAAFLDIQMGGINGLELARRLCEQNPKTNIIFVTGYREYTTDAFDLLASGYVMKPVSAEDIKKQMDNLRYTIQSEENPKRVKVQCFGNFEVYLDGEPVQFNFMKSKEMLAYLIDRKGALCSNHEIMAAIFEEDISESYFRRIRLDLLNALPQELFTRQRGQVGLNKSKISCDYYDYLEEKKTNALINEYMHQYSWSEITLSELLCEK